MTIDLEELLPCPFCGADAEQIDIEEGENAGGSCIACTRCMASSNVEFEFKENFVSNWNSRVDSDRIRALEAENARLREVTLEEAAQAVEGKCREIERKNCCGRGVRSSYGDYEECCGNYDLIITDVEATAAIRALKATPPGFHLVPVEPSDVGEHNAI